MSLFDHLKDAKKALPTRFALADHYKQLLRLLARSPLPISPCYPDFLCIGAPRSGTSWLFRNLHRHRDIYIPWFKEVHFFDEPVVGEAGETRRPLFDLNEEWAWRWYSMVFRPGRGRTRGDITPAYMLLSRERIRLIRQRMPNVKLIFVIRNPIDRAWSGTRRGLWYDQGMKPSDMASLERLRQAVFAPAVIERGDYRRCLENWESEFGTDRLHCLFYEDLFQQPEQQLEGIVDFLGIAPYPDMAALNLEKRVNAAPFEQPPAPIREQLVATYQGQISYLEERFQRDLSDWLEVPA